MKTLVLIATLASGCATRAAQGILVLKVAPPDARITLDAQYIGSAQQLSGHRLRINAGHRRVEVSADGHYAARRDVEVPVNGQTELSIELHAVPDGERGD